MIRKIFDIFYFFLKLKTNYNNAKDFILIKVFNNQEKLMSEVKLTSKTGKVLNHLLNGNTITLKDCLRFFRCSSVAQRIQALEERGYKIKSTPIVTKNKERIARYSLMPVRRNFNNLADLKRFVGLVENNPTAFEDLQKELKQFYKRYTK